MEGIDDETLRRGGCRIICPICLEKKRLWVCTSCCGQDICELCFDSHRDECTRKSLKHTCMYCRAEVVSSNKKLNGLLRKHADEGKDWAQYLLGYKYIRGDGFDRNVPEAVRYIQMAAEKGYAPAQWRLGLFMSEKGEGVPQDWEKSFYWFLQAANQGFARGQFAVGDAYYNGQGVDKDIDQAFIWCKKSADLEYHWGQYNLGVLYRNGLGTTPKDEDIALKYFLLAAKEGNLKAIYQARDIYYNRCLKEGGTKHIYNAIYYCRKFIKLSETKKFDTKKDSVLKELSSLSSICRVCCKKGEGYKCCSKCTCVYYCSVDCQKRDWKENGHKEECKKLDF